jgi:hypothetical protein
MATVNNAVNNLSAPGQCQFCGSMRQTAPVTFHRNIGMLVARQTKRLTGNLCKTCVKKNFWDFTAKNLVFGPWGMISLVVTPIYLVTNTVSYVSALQKLNGAVE